MNALLEQQKRLRASRAVKDGSPTEDSKDGRKRDARAVSIFVFGFLETFSRLFSDSGPERPLFMASGFPICVSRFGVFFLCFLRPLIGVLARGVLRPVGGQQAWEYHKPGTPPPPEPGSPHKPRPVAASHFS